MAWETRTPWVCSRCQPIVAAPASRPSAASSLRNRTISSTVDESIAVGDGDLVLVPRGYHPVAAGARNESYYLNVMAGPLREWRITADPAFAGS